MMASGIRKRKRRKESGFMAKKLDGGGDKFGAKRFEAFAQVENRIAFAGKKCVYVFTRERGDVLESERFQLVPHEHFALFLRKLGERSVQLFPEQIPELFG